MDLLDEDGDAGGEGRSEGVEQVRRHEGRRDAARQVVEGVATGEDAGHRAHEEHAGSSLNDDAGCAGAAIASSGRSLRVPGSVGSVVTVTVRVGMVPMNSSRKQKQFMSITAVHFNAHKSTIVN